MTTIIIIVLGTLYMIPGFIFGIFAWDAPVTSPLDYAKKIAMHTVMTVGWLPFAIWCLTIDDSWKDYFKNYHGSDKHLRRVLGRDYERLMKKYRKYIPKNKN